MKGTTIRAVEMVREIREAMYQETKEMSPEEYRIYIAERAAKVEAEIAQSADARHP